MILCRACSNWHWDAWHERLDGLGVFDGGGKEFASSVQTTGILRVNHVTLIPILT